MYDIPGLLSCQQFGVSLASNFHSPQCSLMKWKRKRPLLTLWTTRDSSRDNNPSLHFKLTNFYLHPRSNDILVPWMRAPRKCTCIGYPSKKLLQSTYEAVLPEERCVGVAYLICEANILSGRKAFGVSMVDCFFFFCMSKQIYLDHLVCDSMCCPSWWSKRVLQNSDEKMHATIYFKQRHPSFEGHTWLSNYCIHYNNGFLTALKWIRAVNNYYTYLPVRGRANWNL
jgi:hypothetical protein